MAPDIIQNRVKSLTPEYSDFVFSDFTDFAISEIVREFGPVNKELLENGIFLYLILFLHKFSLIEFLISECSIDIKNSITITDKILALMPVEMLEQQTVSALALEITDGVIKDDIRYNLLTHDVKSLHRFLFIKTNSSIISLANKYIPGDESKMEQLKIILGDIILGFYKIEDTVPLLQQELELDAKTAALLGAEVLDLLAPLSDPNWQPPVETDDDNTEPDTAQAIRPAEVTPINSPESIVEQQEAVLPPLRTMASDMLEERSPVRTTYNPVAEAEVPVYQSTQPVITKPIIEAPSYNAPLYQPSKPNVDAPLEKPRWG
jgi:hypothetical protein